MELERLRRADPLVARVPRPRDVLVEDPRALLERLPELLLLAREPHVDRVRLRVQLGVRRRHQLAHDRREAGEERALDPDPPALQQRPAHHAPQHVAAILVRRHDAVRDEERHPARVVREDPQRAVRVEVRPVRAPGELLAEPDQRQELVGLEDRVGPLLDQRHPVEAEAGVDVLLRQRRERPDRVLVVLHEDEVPVLQEALVLAARQVVGLAPLHAAVEVELRARAARPGRPRLPEVLRARAGDDPLARDADREPRLDRLLVEPEAERLVALEDRDPDVLGLEAEALERELPRELDRARLEVVAEREVAEHLEEREVPGRRADDLDVRRAEALLAAREPMVRRLLLAREVRLERVHPRRREQHGRVVARRDQRTGGQPPVVALGEEGEEALADLVGRHVGCESRLGRRCPLPASRRPAWSTRTAGCGCTRTGSTRPGLYAWVEKPPGAVIVPLEDDGRLARRAVPPPGPAGACGTSRRAPGRTRRTRPPRTSPAASSPRRPGSGRRRWSGWARSSTPTGSSTSASTSGWPRDSNPARPPRTPPRSTCAARASRVAELEAMIARGGLADAASVAAWHLVSRR